MKQLLLLFLIFNTYTLAFSQENKFTIGLQGGGNISSINHTYRGQTQGDFGIRTLFSASLLFQYTLNKHFSLRVDPGYEYKGYIYFPDYDPGHINYSAINGNFHYLTIPMLLRASIGKKVKYFLNAGPYTGFLLSQNTVYEDYNNNDTKESDINKYTPLDFGISSGIGISMPMSKSLVFSIEARNNIGLLNISKYSSISAKTFSVNLLFGFAYKFGAKIKSEKSETIYLN